MTIDEIKNTLSGLLVKGAALSPSDKNKVRAIIKESGLPISIKRGCPDCWKDAVIQLSVHYEVRPAVSDEAIETGSGNYKCIKTGVWHYKGISFPLNANTPDWVIERFFAAFPAWAVKYYTRVEKSEKTSVPAGEEAQEPKIKDSEND